MIRVVAKVALWSLTVLVVGFLLAFWGIFLSPRPPVTTDPATLAGDGSTIDYCELPALDGSGKLARDIPKGNTPGCSYAHFPLPILAECTEPLAAGADDIRGLWLGVEGRVGHVERIEQCGRRVVVTSSGIIHDYGPNSTLGENTNDTEGSVVFRIGGQALLPAIIRQHDLEPRGPGFPYLRLGTGGGAALPGWRATRVGIRGWQRHPNGSHLYVA